PTASRRRGDAARSPRRTLLARAFKRAAERELEDHRRPVLLVLDRESGAERSRTLGEDLEGAPPPFARGVVAGHEMAGLGVRGSGDLEAGGRSSADRLLEGFARDLVQRRLLALTERVHGGDVERDVHRVLARA